MSKLQAMGTLEEIFATEQKTERFRVREFVLRLDDGNPDYEQLVKFQMTGDHCEDLDDFAVGDEVSFLFDLRGRKWVNPKGKVIHFNTLHVWNIKKVTPAPAAKPVAVADDDVPF